MSSIRLINAVAEALHRRSRVEEWTAGGRRAESGTGDGWGTVDLDTYLGWYPWDNLGSAQDEWRERARTAIDAYEAEVKAIYRERLEQAQEANVE